MNSSTSIGDALRLFFAPSDVFEVRVVGTNKRTQAGWFRGDRLDDAARRIADAAKLGSVYFTPQRLEPSIYKRCANMLTDVRRLKDGRSSPQLTHDADVIARRFLLIDVDPVRAAGHERACSTDAEKAESYAVTSRVREFFSSHAWADPVMIDSGNGYHLYYRLPTEEQGGPVADWRNDNIASLLRCLAVKFDTPGAKVDTSVFNASRIMKVPGTLAKKGQNSKERPHRMSAVLKVPDRTFVEHSLAMPDLLPALREIIA